jgi:hypothetical protein
MTNPLDFEPDRFERSDGRRLGFPSNLFGG